MSKLITPSLFAGSEEPELDPENSYCKKQGNIFKHKGILQDAILPRSKKSQLLRKKRKQQPRRKLQLRGRRNSTGFGSEDLSCQTQNDSCNNAEYTCYNGSFINIAREAVQQAGSSGKRPKNPVASYQVYLIFGKTIYALPVRYMLIAGQIYALRLVYFFEQILRTGFCECGDTNYRTISILIQQLLTIIAIRGFGRCHDPAMQTRFTYSDTILIFFISDAVTVKRD